MTSDRDPVFVVLFIPPPELGEKTRVAGVFLDRQEAAFFAEAQIRFTDSKLRAGKAECPPYLLQYYRDDYTDDEKRAWFEIVKKTVMGRMQ